MQSGEATVRLGEPTGMEIREVARGAFACLVPDRGWGWSNAGYVAAGGGLMVDTFMDVARTRVALAGLREVAPAWQGDVPARLVNTHHNVDHCFGNQLFQEREIIGHRLCAEGMARDLTPAAIVALLGSAELSDGLRWFADDVRAFDFSEVEVTPPNRWIEHDTELDLGTTSAHLLTVGPAHTAGDVVVHLPEEGVVYAGDVLFRDCTPIGWEGTFAGWMAALDRLIALEPAVIVPGHGPVCGPEGAAELRDYFAFVYEEARIGWENELSIEDAARRIDLGPFGAWSQPERLVFNVARAYRELRGGAVDEPVPATELMNQAVALRRHWERGPLGPGERG
jgi:glyoxylase-like metal-dependent hydrolase (beta-lactamase superfamily II)